MKIAVLSRSHKHPLDQTIGRGGKSTRPRSSCGRSRPLLYGHHSIAHPRIIRMKNSPEHFDAVIPESAPQ